MDVIKYSTNPIMRIIYQFKLIFKESDLPIFPQKQCLFSISIVRINFSRKKQSIGFSGFALYLNQITYKQYQAKETKTEKERGEGRDAKRKLEQGRKNPNDSNADRLLPDQDFSHAFIFAVELFSCCSYFHQILLLCLHFLSLDL